MNEFAVHANHNHSFYELICEQYPDSFYDWKIIVLYYVAFHYLKALAILRKKNIGDTHLEINRNIRRGPHNPRMPISDTACENYMALFHYSQNARYDGIADVVLFQKLMDADHKHACKCFRDFKKFVITQGVKIEKIK